MLFHILVLFFKKLQSRVPPAELVEAHVTVDFGCPSSLVTMVEKYLVCIIPSLRSM
jgi:hypothetical protein